MPFLVSKLYFKESEVVGVDPSDKTGFPISFSVPECGVKDWFGNY